MRRWCLAENANANFSLVIPPEKIGVALHQDQMTDIQRDLKGKFSLCWEPECEVWVTLNWLFLLWYEVISAMQDYQFQPSNFCLWSPLTLFCWKNLGIPYFDEQNSQAVKLSLLPVLRQQLHVVSTCVSRAGKVQVQMMVSGWGHWVPHCSSCTVSACPHHAGPDLFVLEEGSVLLCWERPWEIAAALCCSLLI